MDKKTLIKRITVIVLAMAIAGFAIYKLVGSIEKNQPKENVLMVKNNIPINAVISENDLNYVKLPKGSIIQGSIQDPKAIVGQRAITPIMAGEQIFPQKLGGNPLALESDDRQLAVPIDMVRSAGMKISKGSQVDIWWVPVKKGDANLGKSEVISDAEQIGISAVVVDIINKNNVSMYNFTTQTTETKDANAKNNNDIPQVAVIKVKESEVKKIISANENGNIYLVVKK